MASSRSSRTSSSSTNRRFSSLRPKIIVCEFGAALTNAYFCPPETKIVEIIAEGQHDPWSSHFCAMLGLEHVVLFQRQSDEVLASMPRHMKDSPFSYAVDVPKLVETVKALIGSHRQ